MPTITALLGLVASCLFCVSAVFGQTNPPPPDPHEMVTHEPRTLAKPADRSGAIELLNRVRKNYDLHGISAPYALKVSFETNGTAETEGEGRMEELSDAGSHWRWTAQMRDVHVVRVGDDNHVYGTNPSEPVPLRVQMVRSALLRPIGRDLGGAAIRSADVERDGKAISCLLLSRAIPPNPAPRAWVEIEYCVDPATGLLQMWSEAPGIYAVYDYNRRGISRPHFTAADFHIRGWPLGSPGACGEPRRRAQP